MATDAEGTRDLPGASFDVLALEIRVRGCVQGVGFRPNVFRLATELGLAGDVCNDADGVVIRAAGAPRAMASFIERIERDKPPLARVEAIETRPMGDGSGLRVNGAFRIVETRAGKAHTEVAPDAAVCQACAREVVSPSERRFRYPFTTCTHCGPRLSIACSIPYDRATTTMAPFALCAACHGEYRDPSDRRFHAEAMACPECGPRARLVHMDGSSVACGGSAELDDVERVVALLGQGEIVAIKGLGGYHLACDATRADVVRKLRERKHRDAKPFALMARDLEVIRRYCQVSSEEELLLSSPAGPIVLLDCGGPDSLPEAVAPGHRTLGFMLPTTPLHVLILREMNAPLVMTSGNLAGGPPVIDDDDARSQLAGIADFVLVHDRTIANRVDDSVARVVGGIARAVRRARGHAPSATRLPEGFEGAPDLLALGADLKSTFCLLTHGEAILSQHQGDLDDCATFDDYEKNLALYARLFDHRPLAFAADMHTGYRSSSLAREHARTEGAPLCEVQHHHAHAASCLVENGRPLDAPPVLAIVLDGLGMGLDQELWGGELLLVDYHRSTRLGTFEPVAMLGGDRASCEPWRNLYAHIVTAMGWPAFSRRFGALDIHRRLSEKPLALLDRMLASGIGAPRASSCGRLFDAVAAALGITFEQQAYEGQAGALLESVIDDQALREEDDALAYPFSIARRDGSAPKCIDPGQMWHALLEDLARGTLAGVVSVRFHRGLARALATAASQLRGGDGESLFDTVVLSGGCFQNRVLFQETERRLQQNGFEVLCHRAIPPNDGGISLGQAAVAAARWLSKSSNQEGD